MPALIAKVEEQILNYHKLHLSLLREKIRKSDKFYLARKTRKEIKPFMDEWMKVYRNAFGKFPHSYGTGQNNIENFWLDQRTIWNKAHKKEWNNNRDDEGRLMEYRPQAFAKKK